MLIVPPENLDWSPANLSGHGFPTHRVVTPSASRLEFRPTAHSRRGVGVFVVLTAGIGTLLGYAVWTLDWGGIAFTCAGTLVSAWLTWLLTSLVERRIFDTEAGCYWSARTIRERSVPPADAVPLADLRGLQIISEEVETTRMSWTAYELNLVLVDGRRVNVVDHVGFEQIRAEAAQLGDFLQLPVWTRR